MRKILSLAIVSALFAVSSNAKTTSEWKKRAVYQLLTDRYAKGSGEKGDCDLHSQPKYCGGDYDGITKNLQYIKDLGFDAIWISPVVDNTENGFHGYWARDWTKLNQHFGNEESLKRMIKTAHDMDIWVMVDVVANHVGPVGNDFSSIVPFNESSHYHPNCDINDWGN